MNPNQLYLEKITSWSREENGEEYLNLYKKIGFLSDYLYHDYEPALGAVPDFHTRLIQWIDNVQDEAQQKLLLKLVPKLFYLGREEFNCLYKTAFNSPIKNWLVDKSELNFETTDYLSQLTESIKQTWFCPVTDSFRINQFYHVNQLFSKHTFRPDWRSLKKFGETSKIVKYILDSNIKRLVLLEDFVGSGTQAKSVLKFACDLVNDQSLAGHPVEILFVPLIICPKGIDEVRKLEENYGNISCKAVIQINDIDLINDDTLKILPELEQYIALIRNTFEQVKGNIKNEELNNLGHFGYKNTGGLVVMYTNTPNNSLPLIFVESDTWSPLFKRHFRD